MLKKNDILTLPIESVNNLGYGVARHEGMAVFVSSAVTGDVAKVRILKVAKTWAAGKAETLVTPSPHRVANTCPSRGCGGCAYRELDYGEECRIKENDVRFAFRKAGVEAEVLPVVSAEKTDGYRNKAQYAVGDVGGKLVAGFFAPKSHRVVPAADCPLQPPAFARAVKVALEYFNENKLTAYNEETGKGLLRHIYLRYSEAEEKILFTLVINGKALPDEWGFLCHLRANIPELSGILINENKKSTNVVLGEKFRPIWGKDKLEDVLCGVRLSIAPDAFFQVNRPAAELLYQKAKELAGLSGRELLWDLYCGAGSIGLYMADACREVVGVEIVPSAVKNAEENARQNSIVNARFVVGDASTPETLLKNAFDERGTRPDVVVLDPPRKGCSFELLEYLASTLRVEKIVYVSCNPDTLARDAAILLPLGYSLSPVTPVNLFPRTGHVESVVCLKRRLDVDMRR